MFRLPSGKITVYELENDPVEIVDLPIENGGSFHSYLVGGIPTPRKNMKVSWDDYSQYMEK